tara:strand:- start:18663 stop:19082 length:420 start_codon:yes stop_codon:yes gene_type:complete
MVLLFGMANNGLQQQLTTNQLSICRICKRNARLDPHHIISQGHAKKTNQLDLITNKGNIVYICRSCHNQTTASKAWAKLNLYESEEDKIQRKVRALEQENTKFRKQLNKPPKSENNSLEKQFKKFLKNVKKELKDILKK